jgi:hypothetical protein
LFFLSLFFSNVALSVFRSASLPAGRSCSDKIEGRFKVRDESTVNVLGAQTAAKSANGRFHRIFRKLEKIRFTAPCRETITIA